MNTSYIIRQDGSIVRREVDNQAIDSLAKAADATPERITTKPLEPKLFNIDGDEYELYFMRQKDIITRNYWMNYYDPPNTLHNDNYLDSIAHVSSKADYGMSFKLYTMPGCCGVVLIHGTDSDFVRIPKEIRNYVLDILKSAYSSVVIYTNSGDYKALLGDNWKKDPIGKNPKGVQNKLFRYTKILNK